jgi:hypothetical protein
MPKPNPNFVIGLDVTITKLLDLTKLNILIQKIRLGLICAIVDRSHVLNIVYFNTIILNL